MSLNKCQLVDYKKQQGGALAIAVFVIIVMSLLSVAISRSISASSNQTMYEVLGTRALLAAEAGNEMTLRQIFPLATSGNPQPAIENCPADSTFRFDSLNINGLNDCVVTTTCRSEPSPVDQAQNAYYFVESTGVCKAVMQSNNTDFSCQNTDETCVSRRVEVEAVQQAVSP